MIQKMSGRRLLAIPLVFLLAAASCLPPQGVDRITAPHSEDTLRYHLETLGQRIASNIRSRPVPPLPIEQEVALVEEYFVLNGQIKRLGKEVSIGAELGSTIAALGRQLDWARHRREQIKAQVEGIVTRQVGAALEKAGLVPPVGPGGANGLFPPSSFFLLKPPFVLVTSPRDRIEIDRSYLLASQLSTSAMEDIERQVEAQGTSALVEVTTGFSLYPAWVSEDESLRHTLETVAHEWTHAYLFTFYPLGRTYFQDHQMRTVNETVASIVGREIGEEVYRRYYAALEPPPAQVAVAAVRDREFDFASRMRTIRGTVDGLLADGRIEEAEAYMEAERTRLVARGFFIRRLNQAYLALHGTYAGNPGFESSIGTIIKDIRTASASLGSFVRKVGAASNYAEFHELIE